MTTMNPDTTATDPRALDAALDVATFLRRHGAGLCDLLEALGQAEAFEALCDLNAQGDHAQPDPQVSQAALQRIVHQLGQMPVSHVDRITRAARLDVDAALRWYGARLTDVLAAFPELMSTQAA